MGFQTLTLIAISSSLVAIVISGICIAVFIRTFFRMKETLNMVKDLDDEMTELKCSIEAVLQRVETQARKVAWLESRHVKRQNSDEEIHSPVSTNDKPSVTERRHRVLKLAGKGLDAQTISSTLGVSKGEVELIIGMSGAGV
jgi:DNA-binding NarL/FixJ family response regulator